LQELHVLLQLARVVTQQTTHRCSSRVFLAVLSCNFIGDGLRDLPTLKNAPAADKCPLRGATALRELGRLPDAPMSQQTGRPIPLSTRV
jgi:hypothetical protein